MCNTEKKGGFSFRENAFNPPPPSNWHKGTTVQIGKYRKLHLSRKCIFLLLLLIMQLIAQNAHCTSFSPIHKFPCRHFLFLIILFLMFLMWQWLPSYINSLHHLTKKQHKKKMHIGTCISIKSMFGSIGINVQEGEWMCVREGRIKKHNKHRILCHCLCLHTCMCVAYKSASLTHIQTTDKFPTLIALLTHQY